MANNNNPTSYFLANDHNANLLLFVKQRQLQHHQQQLPQLTNSISTKNQPPFLPFFAQPVMSLLSMIGPPQEDKCLPNVKLVFHQSYLSTIGGKYLLCPTRESATWLLLLTNDYLLSRASYYNSFIKPMSSSMNHYQNCLVISKTTNLWPLQPTSSKYS